MIVNQIIVQCTIFLIIFCRHHFATVHKLGRRQWGDGILFYRPDMTDQITTALTALQNSKFRSRFKLTDKERRYIQTKGIDTIQSHAFDSISTKLALAFPKNDGKQAANEMASSFHCPARDRHLLQGDAW
jgi:hypothetical protein